MKFSESWLREWVNVGISSEELLEQLTLLGLEVDDNVVCGAPNARVGIKVPFARVGAVLPGNFKIKRARLRGVECTCRCNVERVSQP